MVENKWFLLSFYHKEPKILMNKLVEYIEAAIKTICLEGDQLLDNLCTL